ncbi:MAG TPA: DUF2244 domain-containing protein [Steroidobacteraceae bacterium]|nr:DUF2244 domain-containing protein [Steroidobacteraceae bacterium]
MELPQAVRIVICPNCSLTLRGAMLFFASACTLSFAVAGFLALRGMWPILPFAALEMLLLAWALHASLARRYRAEIITLTDADVSVEERDRAYCRRTVFPRHWAQVKLRRPASKLHPSRLTIESHGRQCELGSFLTEEERCGLAMRLQRLIGRINESPSLALGPK